jgi:hypothetical protein
MNEWVTVRRELFILIGKSNRSDLSRKLQYRSPELSALLYKHCSWCSQRWSTQPELGLPAECQNFQQPGLLTFVETPDDQPSEGASPRASGLLVGAGTSSTRNSQLSSGLPVVEGAQAGWQLSLQASGLSAPNVETSDYQKSTNYVKVFMR